MTAEQALMFTRVAIAVLFLLSAGGKLLAMQEFTRTVTDFRLLPRHWSKAAALLFIAGEVAVVGLAAIGGSLLPAAFVLAVALLAIFAVALASVLGRGIDMSCSCFGRSDRHISGYDIARNLLMLLCSLAGLWLLGYPRHGLPVGQAALLALMGGVFVVLVVNLRDVVETLRQPF